MTRRTQIRLVLALVAYGSGCTLTRPQPAGAPARISPESLMTHVSALAADSMEGRLAGSAGGARARTYLLRAFHDAGLEPIGTTFERPFSIAATTAQPARTGVNVVGQIRGRLRPDTYVVVTAHYDHLGVRNGVIYNGADDNASGTAALIEIARWLSRNPPVHSVIIAALDAEEGGLLGAREFVRSPPVPMDRIALNVNLDMVSRNAKNELYAAGTSHSPFLKPYLDSVAMRSSITLRLGHDDPKGPPQDDWTLQSDHGAFHRAGIPFVYFGVEDHPDYHRPTDDVDRVMPVFYGHAISTILDAIRTLDRNLETITAAKSR